ncbi:hypothetical protein Tco_0823298 [Tanacetum coccineum]|uniref:Zinc finger, CCHC-type n=1 Tax=Tanacetum coccineum TaxID=301880 RepID=A0ABQ5AM48_9ASTR
MSPIRSKNYTSLAIGERHLPIESTIASRSTDVMVAEQQEVAWLMLVSMTPEIQKNLEDRTAFEILQLKTMFQQQSEQELFETVKAFHACKQEEGQFISTYVLKMKAYLDQIERLGYPMPLVLRTIPELHAMLKLVEKITPKKAPAILAIRQGQIQKPKPQAQDWTLEEELSFIFGRVEEEQSQHVWHIRTRTSMKLPMQMMSSVVFDFKSALQHESSL